MGKRACAVTFFVILYHASHSGAGIYVPLEKAILIRASNGQQKIQEQDLTSPCHSLRRESRYRGSARDRGCLDASTFRKPRFGNEAAHASRLEQRPTAPFASASAPAPRVEHRLRKGDLRERSACAAFFSGGGREVCGQRGLLRLLEDS